MAAECDAGVPRAYPGRICRRWLLEHLGDNFGETNVSVFVLNAEFEANTDLGLGFSREQIRPKIPI